MSKLGPDPADSKERCHLYRHNPPQVWQREPWIRRWPLILSSGPMGTYFPVVDGRVVRLPSMRHPPRASPEQINAARLGILTGFLAGGRITNARDWGLISTTLFPGSIYAYGCLDHPFDLFSRDPYTDYSKRESFRRWYESYIEDEDPRPFMRYQTASLERTPHYGFRRHGRMYFITLLGDDLPSFHFWGPEFILERAAEIEKAKIDKSTSLEDSDTAIPKSHQEDEATKRDHTGKDESTNPEESGSVPPKSNQEDESARSGPRTAPKALRLGVMVEKEVEEPVTRIRGDEELHRHAAERRAWPRSMAPSPEPELNDDDEPAVESDFEEFDPSSLWADSNGGDADSREDALRSPHEGTTAESAPRESRSPSPPEVTREKRTTQEPKEPLRTTATSASSGYESLLRLAMSTGKFSSSSTPKKSPAETPDGAPHKGPGKEIKREPGRESEEASEDGSKEASAKKREARPEKASDKYKDGTRENPKEISDDELIIPPPPTATPAGRSRRVPKSPVATDPLAAGKAKPPVTPVPRARDTGKTRLKPVGPSAMAVPTGASSHRAIPASTAPAPAPAPAPASAPPSAPPPASAPPATPARARVSATPRRSSRVRTVYDSSGKPDYRDSGGKTLHTFTLDDVSPALYKEEKEEDEEAKKKDEEKKKKKDEEKKKKNEEKKAKPHPSTRSRTARVVSLSDKKRTEAASKPTEAKTSTSTPSAPARKEESSPKKRKKSADSEADASSERPAKERRVEGTLSTGTRIPRLRLRPKSTPSTHAAKKAETDKTVTAASTEKKDKGRVTPEVLTPRLHLRLKSTPSTKAAKRAETDETATPASTESKGKRRVVPEVLTPRLQLHLKSTPSTKAAKKAETDKIETPTSAESKEKRVVVPEVLTPRLQLHLKSTPSTKAAKKAETETPTSTAISETREKKTTSPKTLTPRLHLHLKSTLSTKAAKKAETDKKATPTSVSGTENQDKQGSRGSKRANDEPDKLESPRSRRKLSRDSKKHDGHDSSVISGGSMKDDKARGSAKNKSGKRQSIIPTITITDVDEIHSEKDTKIAVPETPLIRKVSKIRIKKEAVARALPSGDNGSNDDGKGDQVIPETPLASGKYLVPPSSGKQKDRKNPKSVKTRDPTYVPERKEGDSDGEDDEASGVVPETPIVKKRKRVRFVTGTSPKDPIYIDESDGDDSDDITPARSKKSKKGRKSPKYG